MSLFRITRDELETFTIIANPERTISSGSSGITGSVSLFARSSPSEKEIQSLSLFNDTGFDDDNLNDTLARAKKEGLDNGNNNAQIQEYLDAVNAKSASARKATTLDVERFVPSFLFSTNTVSKTQIIDTLMPYYRTIYPQAHYAYTNYHCLNFFTSSEVPSTSAIVYPNTSSGSNAAPYTLDGGFSFDFWINPKYTTDDEVSEFKAGTILHLSGCYALSLITGSSKDSKGFPDRYRVQLQLSQSAEVSPSEAVQGAFPNDLVFLSDDNSLKRNNWHHVVVRWGTSNRDHGTGSFVVDGAVVGSFVVPSSSISATDGNSLSALVVGNFFEGSNGDADGALSNFFASDPASRDGLIVLNGTAGIEQPFPMVLDHPLNAEIHDLKIYDDFRTVEQITDCAPPVNEPGLRFYVPPFFTKESPTRKFVGTFGGVLQTPFFAVDGFTDDPFNVALSFGVGGHYLNNENFARDMVNDNYPRWLHLTASESTVTDTVKTANEFLYDETNGSVQKRNLTLLPCDNGLFEPNFKWLLTGSNHSMVQAPASGSELAKYVNDLGTLDLSFISLRDLIPEDFVRKALLDETGSLFNQIAGSTPENPGVDPGEVLTILQRTRDNTSNEVVYFDMSNIFYGERINPGTLSITDTALTGSDSKISMTIKDDEIGSLYRADALTAHAKWNSIGNIFYNEGIMVIKSPNIPLFGKEQWDMSFEAEHCIHTLKFDVIAPPGLVDSSSNPSYQLISASFDANDKDSKFVYITNILFLDDNLNVVMKSNLSQPINKRRGDKFTFRPKIDF